MRPLKAPRQTAARGTAERRQALHRRLRQGAAAAVALGALAGGIAWAVHNGQAARLADGARGFLQQAQRSAGLTVQGVFVEGRVRSARDELLGAIGVRRGDLILAFDPDEARRRLLALPWVKNASVTRKLPDTVEVRLHERRPLALWQHDRELVLIGLDGEPITDKELGRFRELPIVVGDDAPRHARRLIETLIIHPALFRRVYAAVRVGGRRWNLQLKNGVEINLPEEDPAAAWARLAELQAAQGLFDRDIEAIDLRLPDRMVVRMTPEAAARRDDGGTRT